MVYNILKAWFFLNIYCIQLWVCHLKNSISTETAGILECSSLMTGCNMLPWCGKGVEKGDHLECAKPSERTRKYNVKPKSRFCLFCKSVKIRFFFSKQKMENTSIRSSSLWNNSPLPPPNDCQPSPRTYLKYPFPLLDWTLDIFILIILLQCYNLILSSL